MASIYLGEKQKRRLRLTIYVIAFFQMSVVCISPAMAGMAEAFPRTSVFVLQMCSSACAFMLVIMSALSGWISGILTRKAMVSGGFLLMAAAGLCGFLFSVSPLAVLVWSALLGIGMGLFVAATSSLLIDYYSAEEQSRIAGVQNCIVNIGGVVLSVAGGLLVSLRWNAGYLCFLLCLGVAVMAWLCVPSEKQSDLGKPKASYRLPGLVWFFGANVIIFSVVYGVFNSNISLLMAERGITPAGTWSGVCIGVFMAGGAICGLCFPPLSKKLGKYIFVAAYLMVALGYLVIVLASSLPIIMVGAFICGSSLSMMIPQSLISIAGIVTPEQSVAAASLVMGIGPQIGGVLSPVIFTRLSMAMGHSTVSFRYGFGCAAAGALAVILAIVLKRLSRIG